MSGFEVAGVVLGAWPILIEGLKFYAEERGVCDIFLALQEKSVSISRLWKKLPPAPENKHYRTQH